MATFINADDTEFIVQNQIVTLAEFDRRAALNATGWSPVFLRFSASTEVDKPERRTLHAKRVNSTTFTRATEYAYYITFGALESIRPSLLMIDGALRSLTARTILALRVDRLAPKCFAAEPVAAKRGLPMDRRQGKNFLAAATQNRQFHAQDLADPFPLLMATALALDVNLEWMELLDGEMETLAVHYQLAGSHEAFVENMVLPLRQTECQMLFHLLAYFFFKGTANQLPIVSANRIKAFCASMGYTTMSQEFLRNDGLRGQAPFPYNNLLLTAIAEKGASYRPLKDTFVRLFYRDDPEPGGVLAMTQKLTEYADCHTFYLALEFAQGSLTLAHALPAIAVEIERLLRAATALEGATYKRRCWPRSMGVDIPANNQIVETASIAIRKLQEGQPRDRGFNNYRGVAEKGNPKFYDFAKVQLTGGLSLANMEALAERAGVDVEMLLRRYNEVCLQAGLGVPLVRVAPGAAPAAANN